MSERDRFVRDQGNGHDVPDENPVAVRRPLIRSIQDVSAQEPQSSTVIKLVDNTVQIVNRIDHMDSDLVDLGTSMVRGFVGIQEQIGLLSSKVDALSGLPATTGLPPPLPSMRRREDSQSAIEDLSRHVSSSVREQAERIVKDPDSTLDPETVTKLAEDAVNKVLAAAKERDRIKALEAEKADRDRVAEEKRVRAAQLAEEQRQQRTRDADRAKDFRRNLTIAIVGALIAGACAIYAAYMTGHENGHDKGVADTLQAVPALTAVATVGLPSESASSPVVLKPASAPANVAPATKK